MLGLQFGKTPCLKTEMTLDHMDIFFISVSWSTVGIPGIHFKQGGLRFAGMTYTGNLAYSAPLLLFG